MKKISILSALVIVSLAIHAQSVGIGIKGGLNLASLDNGPQANFNNRLAYHAGLSFNIPVSSQISVQPEVVYSSQGAKYTVADLEHSLGLNYINIPLMIQAQVGKGFYAEAGPQIGLLTGVTDKANNIETGFFTSEDFKKSDVAVGVGLGYRGTSGIGIGARYNLGLTNINNAGTNNLKNNVLQIGLSYNFSGSRL